MTPRSGARTRLGGVALLVLVLAGCRVDTTVAVDVAEDGSGTVTVEVVLDQEAAERIPDLDEQLRVRDLRRTGWEVVGPEPAEGGGAVITATKPFADPDQLSAVLAEIGGLRNKMLEGTLTRERPFGRTVYEFEGTLDLSRGPNTFSDPQLTELLDGNALGLDLAALEEELGSPLSDRTTFTFVLSLPEGDDDVVTEWEARLGDDPVAMAASTEERNATVFAFAAGALAAAVLLVLLLVWRLFRRNKAPIVHRD